MARGNEKCAVTREQMRRIRWRCRRGMLENDLVLTRYLDAKAGTMSAAEVAMLDRLLDLPDNDLWDLIAGRATPSDSAMAGLVHQLRAPHEAARGDNGK